MPIASSLSALSRSCIGSPRTASARHIPGVNRSATKSIGLAFAALRQRTDRNHAPSSTAGTDSQLTVTGTQPYLYASAEYITNASAEKLFM